MPVNEVVAFAGVAEKVKEHLTASSAADELETRAADAVERIAVLGEDPLLGPRRRSRGEDVSAFHDGRRLDAGRRKQGRGDVDGAHQGRVDGAGRNSTSPDDERDPDQLFEEGAAVEEAAVVAELLTMVGGDQHHRVVEETDLRQAAEEFAEAVIEETDLAVILRHKEVEVGPVEVFRGRRGQWTERLAGGLDGARAAAPKSSR